MAEVLSDLVEDYNRLARESRLRKQIYLELIADVERLRIGVDELKLSIRNLVLFLDEII